MNEFLISMRRAFDGSLWVEARMPGDPQRRVGTVKLQGQPFMHAVEQAEESCRQPRRIVIERPFAHRSGLN